MYFEIFCCLFWPPLLTFCWCVWVLKNWLSSFRWFTPQKYITLLLRPFVAKSSFAWPMVFGSFLFFVKEKYFSFHIKKKRHPNPKNKEKKCSNQTLRKEKIFCERKGDSYTIFIRFNWFQGKFFFFENTLFKIISFFLYRKCNTSTCYSLRRLFIVV